MAAAARQAWTAAFDRGGNIGLGEAGEAMRAACDEERGSQASQVPGGGSIVKPGIGRNSGPSWYMSM
jgi:hypothetical protein